MAPSPRPATEIVGARDRWLALGLLVAVVLAAYALLVHPSWTVPMQQEAERIEALQQRELRLRAQLLQAPVVAERLAALRAQQGGQPGFLVEASPELATASLVRRLETAVAEASPGNRSCAISNRSPLDPDTRERYTRVVAQVRLRCGTPELTSVLHALESGSPRLFVDNLNILAQRMYLNPASGTPTGTGGLDVSFDLSGYLLPGPEAAGAD